MADNWQAPRSNLQWMRRVQLLIGAENGDWIDVSELRITFRAEQAMTDKPGSLVARIYNMANDTAQRIQREGAPVILQAGHQGNAGLIYKGLAIQILRGRESGTDTYLQLVCQDGDTAYIYSTCNKTLDAGWKQSDQKKAIDESLKKHGVQNGVQAEYGDVVAVRGKAMFGAARDYLREFALSTGTEWAIRDGQLDMTPGGMALPGEAFVLNAFTGMIGMPVQTLDGVLVRSLLNPGLRRGQQIKLEHDSIQQAALSPSYKGMTAYNAPLDRDGYYNVYHVTHTGDTRGNEYYTDMICVAVDPLATPVSRLFVSVIENNGF